ncbi:type II toxin-antitoxin system HicA family toxin [Planctomyces sp. SH-PL62]|uniref:type II toxin-antitoxin system HicA family toxin n=1 Tax=Planctomyces sp. SH-PL62 TaxID=1636152 RepID=UPI00078E6B8A|nr:type II toxin-antitoxin system HicA family toxin [Planctomyces sp. SH-PL62]AMV40707.1 hypothetical protein VT85_24965 [Planctomyces sp. SH-PL62]
MSTRHARTLLAIFDDPARADVAWRDVESLLASLGAELTEGRGSRVRVALNGVRAVFHEPHPEEGIGKGMLRSLRDFLTAAGVAP